MKDSLTKLVLTSLIVLALFASQAYGKTLEVYFHNVNCSNGFQNAFMVTVVDVDTGCIEACWGTDCSGKEYVNNNLVKVPLTTEPTEGSATFTDRDVASNGRLYTVNVRMNEGVVSGIWGEDATGTYYRVDL